MHLRLAVAAGSAIAQGIASRGTTIHALRLRRAARQLLTEGRYAAFTNANLSTTEFTRITTLSGFIQTKGSGFGICKSCLIGGLGAVQPQLVKTCGLTAYKVCRPPDERSVPLHSGRAQRHLHIRASPRQGIY
jgi:hypothetical protein